MGKKQIAEAVEPVAFAEMAKWMKRKYPHITYKMSKQNGKWDGGILLPINSVNKCGCLFYDNTGLAEFYDSNGVSRALIAQLAVMGWHVYTISLEEGLEVRPIDG